MLPDKLHVAVTTPLSPKLRALITTADPRIHLLYDESLLRPRRWPADYAGDPAFIRTPAQQAAYMQLLQQSDALFGLPDMNPRMLAAVIRANPDLRWVHTLNAGGGADIKAAQLTAEELRRVTFTTSAGVHAEPLAEFVLLGLLAALKDLPRLQKDQRNHRWPHRWSMRSLTDQTVIIIGMGSIGREVAHRLAPFGTRLIGTSRHPLDDPDLAAVVDPRDTEAMKHELAHADAAVVTLPGTNSTYHLVSAELLAATRPGITIVSVGRGSVVDQEALVAGLRTGHIGYAALDVAETEPLPADSPLWDMSNVLISPHTAANTPGELDRIARLFAQNAVRYLAGQHLRNIVNTREFY
jgi:phosphoglycerate dehydrogenase-like enzyme